MPDSEEYAVSAADQMMAACVAQDLGLRGLPEFAYVCEPALGPGQRIVAVKRGMTGYLPVEFLEDPEWNDGFACAVAHKFNAQIGVGPVEAAAMAAGARYGWEVPSADPRRYTAEMRRRLESERMAALLLQ